MVDNVRIVKFSGFVPCIGSITDTLDGVIVISSSQGATDGAISDLKGRRNLQGSFETLIVNLVASLCANDQNSDDERDES